MGDRPSRVGSSRADGRSLRRPLLIGAAVVVGVVVLAAVAGVMAVMRIGSTSDAPAAVLTRDDPAAALSPGDRFEVRLAENPSVGDDWRSDDVDGLRRVEAVLDTGGRERAPGTGGIRVITYEAVTVGTHELRYVNCFRGDCTGPDAQQVTFVVTVA